MLITIAYLFVSWLTWHTRLESSDDTLYSNPGAAWDEVFRAENGPSHLSKSSLKNTVDAKPMRSQTITERESKIITDMLDMVFNKRRSTENSQASDIGKNDVGGGGGQIDINDIVSRLRRHSKPLRWAKEPTADLLDQKKEQMMLCNSDQELLDWAQREVFAESKRYEEAAKKAIEEASSSTGNMKELPRLQSPVYPQVIAHLMRTFRDHYRDPNLALFIFHHAQKLSIISYVFGCSTEAYNELIQTRWSCFRDLHGVYAAVNEMMVNAVPLDSTTRKLIENVRRDIGSIELHPDASPEGRRTVWGLLSKVEQTVAVQTQAKPEAKVWDRWKTEILNEGVDHEDWSIGNWLTPETQLSQQKLKAANTRRALSKS